MIHPHSKVDLARVDGSDNDIALAASICYGKQYIDNTKVDGLLKALLQQKHLTPFEWGRMWFTIRCTRACHSQFLQYRTASRVTRSLRRTEPIEIEENLYTSVMDQATFDWYEVAIKSGMPREEARKGLTMDTLTDFHWYIDIRNLMHFLYERLAKDAQDEIRFLADGIEELFADSFPITHQYWRELKDAK